MLALPATAPAQEPGGGSDVIGGQPTTVEEWPHQVAIAQPVSPGEDGYDRQFCGGSLVSATAVLTAAHCVSDDDGNFNRPSDQNVISGRTTLSSDEGAESLVTDVIYFVEDGGTITPQSVLEAKSAGEQQLWDASTFEWDVAVLELGTAAVAPAAPIEIADETETELWDDEGDRLFATGWGEQTAYLAQDYPDRMRVVELQRISDANCGDATSYGSQFYPNSMVCAGIPTTGGKDTCSGDSGGPLVAPAGDGSLRLVGDTSFGLGCALPEKYGVYGRVADVPMRPAIESAISLAAGDPGSAAPLADRQAPQTKLDGKPRKRTRRRRATFTFSATESATFTCSVDGGAGAPCSSPFRQRFKRGRHTFAVHATDTAGNVESKPARYSWRVKRKRR